VVWLSAQGTTPTPPRLRGFSVASSAAQVERERAFKLMPSAKLAEADFDVMTAEPHHTGSPYEIKLADYVADRFKSFGIEATKYEYSVLLPWPGQRRIDIVAPDEVKLQVEEEKIRGDQWADKPGILPAYNAYSPSGDVTGEIVYVNYGIPPTTTLMLGIDVKGKIVLARTAEASGIKPKVAAEHGAIACIIYSDPHEDATSRASVSRRSVPRLGNDSARQRDDMPCYLGDPSTPGRPRSRASSGWRWTRSKPSRYFVQLMSYGRLELLKG
jgi:N-acetylated-alpha-linked acidic dipeptidase